MFEIFKEIRGLKVFMSEKKDGNMKLFASDFDFNRKKYLEKVGLKYENLVSAKLEHGNQVAIVKSLGSLEGQKVLPGYCDGLLSNDKDIILSVTSADCLPIFLFDPTKKVIGILHCGWRSVAKGIIEKALNKMKNNFQSDLRDVLIGIGPGIQKCHFEVGKDFLKNFEGYDRFVSNKKGRKFFDLKGVAVEKLIFLGIREVNIEIDQRCTYCEEGLYSYRRDGFDKKGDVQAMMGGVAFNF
jgi:hypothetical protein